MQRLRRGHLQWWPPPQGRRSSSTALAARGSAMQRRPRRWRASPHERRRFEPLAVCHADFLPGCADLQIASSAMPRCICFVFAVESACFSGRSSILVGELPLRAVARLMRHFFRGQVHAHGLVWVVNPGAGTAALLCVALCLGRHRRNRPVPTNFPSAAQILREANFSGLPVLRCAAAPSLRFGMRRAPAPRRSDHAKAAMGADLGINLERTSS
jgi:hypothetical protein